MGLRENHSNNFCTRDGQIMPLRGTIKTLEEARKELQKMQGFIKLSMPGYGTAFPTNPVDGKILTRTDLDITYQYINGGWVDISTGGGGGTPTTDYLLLMSGERAEWMDGTDFILMSASA